MMLMLWELGMWTLKLEFSILSCGGLWIEFSEIVDWGFGVGRSCVNVQVHLFIL